MSTKLRIMDVNASVKQIRHALFEYILDLKLRFQYSRRKEKKIYIYIYIYELDVNNKKK